MSVLVVGSVGIDRVQTPKEDRSDLLGGSASFAGLAASFHAPVSLIGIVGNDFPAHHRAVWEKRNIDSDIFYPVYTEEFCISKADSHLNEKGTKHLFDTLQLKLLEELEKNEK